MVRPGTVCCAERMAYMKILTLNTHSLQEENYEQKLNWFVEGILKERPDIIAMQEVNQWFPQLREKPLTLHKVQ